MPAYKGYHADLYDLFYKEKNYKAEANFVHSLINGDAENILELACGTGNHSFYLAKMGYKILATDNSDDMLRIAKKKLASFINVKVEKMDMLRFSKFNKPFDAVICLFDSIGYVQTNENILKVLKNVHKVLNKQGLFIFEFWNAGAMLRSFEPLREKTWRTGNKKIIRQSKTKLRYSEQLAEVTYSIFEYEENKLIRTIKEKQTNRYFLIKEIEFFLSQSGFEIVNLFDGYSRRTNITENSWHTVCIAKKL